MDELKAQAESLGIDVDGRWSEKRIQAEIDKALEAPAPASESKAAEIEISINAAPGMSDADVASAVSCLPAKDAATYAEQKESPVTVTNLRDNPIKRLGLKGRGQIVLTSDQLSNKQLMARIMHGVETGVLGLS